uniref:SHSP domain-containing protein n=1 Tax=Glossina brevipalpis TaxID=37001 RepID=A0A1A9W4C8_9MUSC
MSTLPLILSLADNLNRLSMAGSPFYDPSLHYARHPLALLTGEPQQLRFRDMSNVGPVSTIGKDGFQVCMDVQQFKPNELLVKTVDNCIIVEGKHEEREDDHGFISRHFVRRYALPKGYDPNKVVSTLSSDGVLTINVPKPEIEDKPNERVVQIQQVGPAHLNVKNNTEENNIESAEKDSKQSKLQERKMSIVPLIAELAHDFNNEMEGLTNIEQLLLEDNFGLGVHPIDIFRPRRRSLMAHPRIRYTPYTPLLSKLRRRLDKDDENKSQHVPTVGKDGFQVCMDVSQFRPNELSVKTVDKTVVIEGKHEEREDDHGLIQRHFIRKYQLPKGYEPKEVVSTISSDGVLTVKAPLPSNKIKAVNERVIEIQQTGPAHLSVKQPTSTKDQETLNGEQSKMDTK